MRYLSAMCVLFLSLTTLHADSPKESLSEQVENSIVKETNSFRKEHDLPPLQRESSLTKTAKRFASFMAETGKYGHHADGKTPAERAKEAGYEYCVVRENIAYRTNTGDITAESLSDVFVPGWIESPPHRENMLADYITQTGVAVSSTDGVTYYAVQLFGRPKSAAIDLTVKNESEQTQTLVVDTNDSTDQVEMPPRSVVTMNRCFPTKLRLKASDSAITLKQSATLTITDAGLMQRSPTEVQ
ncbi:CAP domain-containing protein [Rhodopirellula sallentina]|uniref:Secreted protein containing SCP-like extracellular domain protein n=1 Tax=Rhodopirellula sallentina SM41 TaxID=1263870 RepID=M5U1H6_9BACT|nr:CAP domain-containing protein [Rhodopirellula sallentina]EMI55134.1 secreted protein containing SCP-like extracellular domain protein [Rhodopirellula sallentina SM41]